MKSGQWISIIKLILLILIESKTRSKVPLDANTYGLPLVYLEIWAYYLKITHVIFNHGKPLQRNIRPDDLSYLFTLH